MKSALVWINVALRGIMELGVVLGFGYWGYYIGNSIGMKIFLAILVPVAGFGFWGLVDMHQFGRMSEPLRLIQEMVLSGLAALAFYMAGAHLFCWLLASLSVLHHALVYSLGERLLKEKK